MANDKKQGYLEKLVEFFPTAVYTGQKLVFVSENWNVEVIEHTEKMYCNLGSEVSTIRVNIYKTGNDMYQRLVHSGDFTLSNCRELAAQIEKYIQNAIDVTIKESSVR